MAKDNEKIEFIQALYELQSACNKKANDGALTSDQRRGFLTAQTYLNSDIGKASKLDFKPIPSERIVFAKQEVKQAIIATDIAHNDETVNIAAKELWDANDAIDQVMPE